MHPDAIPTTSKQDHSPALPFDPARYRASPYDNHDGIDQPRSAIRDAARQITCQLSIAPDLNQQFPPLLASVPHEKYMTLRHRKPSPPHHLPVAPAPRLRSTGFIRPTAGVIHPETNTHCGSQADKT
jgi:hypothetical protein